MSGLSRMSLSLNNLELRAHHRLVTSMLNRPLYCRTDLSDLQSLKQSSMLALFHSVFDCNLSWIISITWTAYGQSMKMWEMHSSWDLHKEPLLELHCPRFKPLSQVRNLLFNANQRVILHFNGALIFLIWGTNFLVPANWDSQQALYPTLEENSLVLGFLDQQSDMECVLREK